MPAPVLPLWLPFNPAPRSTIAPPQISWRYLAITNAPGKTASTHRLHNALAETVIGLFKTEVIRHRGPWRSLEAVEFATLEWVDWFSHRCLLEPIGNMPPAEAEARYHTGLEEPALAA